MAEDGGKSDGKSIDERLEALTMNLELAWREIEAMRAAAAERDKVIDLRMDKILTYIEKLAGIAESHGRRIDDLEGGRA